MKLGGCAVCLLAAAGVARAQPAPAPVPDATPDAPDAKDATQLAATLAQITNDPAIQVDDPAIRAQAQALMLEGLRQLDARAFDQALANFLEAYAKFPSPRILLNIGSTLRDMGRLADAANTYQRFLTDPATGADRVGEVKQLLIELDQRLTILTIRVIPHGSQISIDAGPFIPVGSSLVTRVRPGLHMVRVRSDDATSEINLNGFEGENKEVLASVQVEVTDPTPTSPTTTATTPTSPTTTPARPEPPSTPDRPPPEHQNGWLITGQYASDGTGNRRGVLTRTAGEPVAAVTPPFESLDDPSLVARAPVRDPISSGIVGALRIDGEGRGFAGALGLAIARGRFEGDLMMLRSNVNGAYLGFRYRLWTGFLRPYAAVGIPGFVFDQTTETMAGESTETKLAIGARIAGGVEIYINGHLSVQGDLGFEHFWFVEGTRFVANVVVPTVGIIGRL